MSVFSKLESKIIGMEWLNPQGDNVSDLTAKNWKGGCPTGSISCNFVFIRKMETDSNISCVGIYFVCVITYSGFVFLQHEISDSYLLLKSRRFMEEDLEGVRIVLCLRDTGMPLADIKKYLDLCAKGSSTSDLMHAITYNILIEILINHYRENRGMLSLEKYLS